MTTAADRIYLLAIDLTPAPAELAAALSMERDDLIVLLDQARIQLGELEAAVICTEERIELYGAGPNWRRGFQLVLRQFYARTAGFSGLGALRVLETNGVAAARHLIRFTTGLETALGQAEALAAVDDAAQAARLAGTLSQDLEMLFSCSSAAAARRAHETTGADAELDVPEIERIVEEELLSWRAWCVRDSRRAAAESNHSSGFPSEPFTFVREIKARRTVA
jgi:glutamyl-tRNA reductase